MASTNIYSYTAYSEFLKYHLNLRAHSGKMKAAAKYLRVSISKLSKAIAGTQHLTLDQAFQLTKYLGLENKEAEYFILLVQISRCSDREYKLFLEKRRDQLRESVAPAVMTELKRDLSQSEESILHSSPNFLAVWLQSMIDNANDFQSISRSLRIEPGVVFGIAKFLESAGFVEIHGSQLIPKTRKLEIGNRSGQLERFLNNWRMEGMHKLNSSQSGNFFLSEPMSIGEDIFSQIKTLLMKTASECQKLVKSQRSETVACLNIDFFKLTK